LEKKMRSNTAEATKPGKTYRTNVYRLLPTKEQARILHSMAKRSFWLLRMTNLICSTHHAIGKRIPNFKTLCKERKTTEEYKVLPADVAQRVLKIVSSTWKGYFALLKKFGNKELQHRPSPPATKKPWDCRSGANKIPVKATKSCQIIDNKVLQLTVPKNLRKSKGTVKKSGTPGVLIIKITGEKRFTGKDASREIIFNRGNGRWYLHQAVLTDIPLPPQRTIEGKSAGIDLGVRITAALSIEGLSHTFHFSGRELLKSWKWHLRRIQEAMSKVSHRPTREWSTKKQCNLYDKQSKQFRHAIYALANQLERLCLKHNVTKVYIGHPMGILDDTQGVCSSSKQLIHGFWAYYQTIEIIERKLIGSGITVEKVPEYYTSSTCPKCDSKDFSNNGKRHLFICNDCGLHLHRDQVGAMNILRFNEPRANWDWSEADHKPHTYIWNKASWNVIW
jgi:transposase